MVLIEQFRRLSLCVSGSFPVVGAGLSWILGQRSTWRLGHSDLDSVSVPFQSSQHGGSSTSLASTKVCSSMDENDGPGEGGELGTRCLRRGSAWTGDGDGLTKWLQKTVTSQQDGMDRLEAAHSSQQERDRIEHGWGPYLLYGWEEEVSLFWRGFTSFEGISTLRRPAITHFGHKRK